MAKRNQIASFHFVLENGETSKQVTAGVVGLVIEFAGTGEKRTVDLADYNDTINTLFAWYGAAVKFQREWAGVENGADALEKFEELEEQLKERGDWRRQGEASGPRTTIVADALFRLATAGKVSAERYGTIELAAATVAAWSKEERAEKVKIPAVAKVIEEIKIERAQARLGQMEGEENVDELAAI